MERVSVVGLGRMGRAIAERLAGKSVTVTGWTRSGASSDVFSVSADLAGAVHSSDVILTSLLDETAVRSVLSQMAALDLTGKLVVETSTVSPAAVRDLEGHITAAGGRLMDAPISGGPETVTTGTAGLYMGGASQDLARFAPIAHLFSDRVVEIGALGSGTAAKIVNNAAMAGAYHAIIDAMQLGNAMGLSLETMLTFLKNSPATTPMFRARIPKMTGADNSVGFAIETSLINCELFLQTAAAYGIDMPELNHARTRLGAAVSDGLGDKDPAALVGHVLKSQTFSG